MPIFVIYLSVPLKAIFLIHYAHLCHLNCNEKVMCSAVCHE